MNKEEANKMLVEDIIREAKAKGRNVKVEITEENFISELVAVRMININTGEVQALEQKSGSTNFFFNPVFHQFNDTTYEICPRLDFPNDPHRRTKPILDIDIWEVSDSKRIKRIPKNEFKHHTTVKSDKTYEWEYKGCKLKFRLTKTWRVPVTLVQVVYGKDTINQQNTKATET